MDKINVKGKKILITGATGFIGSHLVKRLANEGNDLVLLVRSIEKAKKIFENHMPKNVEIIAGDVLDIDILKKCVRDVDIIFHEAVSNFALEEAVQDFRVNVIGTINLLSTLLESDVERFFYPSTIHVYGNPATVPINENTPTSPLSSYGRSKLSAERLVSLLSETYGLKSTVVRFSNMYGPSQVPRRGQGVVADIIDAALTGQTMNITGGSRKRSYTFVDDVVDITILSAIKKNTENEIFNAASSEILTTNDMIKIVSELTGKEIKVVYAPESPIGSSYPDITKMKKLLGYECKTKFVDGVKETIEWQTQKTIL
jgi:UDP-glucose 4-epimerase